MTKRVVLAYSGGLDTSVAVRWMIEEWGVEVVTVACDVGQGGDFEEVCERARAAGAVEAVVADARAEFADDFVAPALKANALYEGRYPLVSALSRPSGDRASSGQRRPDPRRNGSCARMHREGQRSGSVRGGDPGVGA